jgi:hypothetical protein
MDVDVGPFAALLSLLGGVLAYRAYFSAKATLHRDMRKTPLADIGSLKAEMAAVRVVGRVKVLGEPGQAPLSGRPCALSEAAALSGEQNGSRDLLYREVGAVDFLLEDVTGGVLVRVPQDAKLVLAQQLEWDVGGPDTKAFLERCDRAGGAGPDYLTKPALLRESILEPGERTAVVGAVRWEHDPDAKQAGVGYRGGPRRLVIEAVMAATDEP